MPYLVAQAARALRINASSRAKRSTTTTTEVDTRVPIVVFTLVRPGSV
jgi:hypothetical protein